MIYSPCKLLLSAVILFLLTSFSYREEVIICGYYLELNHTKDYYRDKFMTLYNVSDTIVYKCSLDSGVTFHGIGKINKNRFVTSYGYTRINPITLNEEFIKDTSIVYDLDLFSEVVAESENRLDSPSKFYYIYKNGIVFDTVQMR